MQALPVCRLCGRSFVQYGRTCHAYCKQCTAKTDREIARVLRVKCKECGKAFSTSNRSVRYCSEGCRNASRAHRSSATGRRRTARGGPAKCHTCGKEFKPDGKPGKPRVYCSEDCRVEGRRRYCREYMRRYIADPEKRAINAARRRAAAAGRGAKSGRGRRQAAPGRRPDP